jgi:hypothetical protein
MLVFSVYMHNDIIISSDTVCDSVCSIVIVGGSVLRVRGSLVHSILVAWYHALMAMQSHEVA